MDSGNARITLYDFSQAPRVVTHPIAGGGIGATTAGATATGGHVARLGRRLLFSDPARNRVVAIDFGTNTVAILSPNPTASAAPAKWFLGQAVATAGAAPGAPSQRSLNKPQDIDIDGNGRVFITDTGHHRVIEHRMYIPN